MTPETAHDVQARQAAARARLWPQKPTVISREVLTAACKGRQRYTAPIGPRRPPAIEKALEKFDRTWAGRISINRRPTLAVIAAVVASSYGVALDDLYGQRRTKHLIRARQAFYFVARNLTPRSLPQIGEHCGRDHTTVLHGVRAVEARMAADPAERDRMKALMKLITVR